MHNLVIYLTLPATFIPIVVLFLLKITLFLKDEREAQFRFYNIVRKFYNKNG